MAFGLRPLQLKVRRMATNRIWSNFVVHGIPTIITSPEGASAIRKSYPHLVLCQIPRSLSSPLCRTNKTHFSMVLPFPGKYNINNLGVRTVTLFNQV